MTISEKIVQQPAPGQHILAFRGDTQTFILSTPHGKKGGAWLRTNIGHSDTRKDEIIGEVAHDETRLHRDWYDIPLKKVSDGTFSVTVGLGEVGHFDAKCYFLPEGATEPVWPPGDNTLINVEPADTCCANIIYNAFVRQFGPNKAKRKELGRQAGNVIQDLDNDGYSVIPPSGTFRDLIKELDFIIGTLGCRVIQLLPIHPTPTTYARMGRFGSPYAALSFTTVNPALAEFDPRATPTEQFAELVDAVHSRNAKVIIDIAINHTGWAARLHNTHPQWLVRDKDGKIQAPGAWGVTWEDLTKLDYSHKDLWRYMAEMFLLWTRRGVDGFRCDAGYMIPMPAWRYITAKVRKQFPDTIFLLEGLGGNISVSRDILNNANLNWAYSELFQNYDRGQIERYLPEPIEIGRTDGVMIHFAETHDNPRLAKVSETYAKMRTALCALFSQHGGFGFANGVEWFATEKIDVHDANPLNWGTEENQVEHIRRLNTLLKIHPAFHDSVDLIMIQKGGGNFVALLRHHRPSGKRLLIVVNLDHKNNAIAAWDTRKAEMDGEVLIDLISEKEIHVTRSGDATSRNLDPGQVLCLTSDRDDIRLIKSISDNQFYVPDMIKEQLLRAKAMDVHRFYHGTEDLGDFDPVSAAGALRKDPVEYCRSINIYSEEPRVVTWWWPRDLKREVMIPPDHFLLVRAQSSFRARVVENIGEEKVTLACENSLQSDDGSFFALFSPLPVASCGRSLDLDLSVYGQAPCQHRISQLLFLPRPEGLTVKRAFQRFELLRNPLLLLGTNGMGGMLRANVIWGRLLSKYDALLAANLSPDFPVDRWIMLTRCRIWVVYQGYSTEINNDCIESFYYDEDFCGYWRYNIPTGQGQQVYLTIAVEMAERKNAIRISFHRHLSQDAAGGLSDSKQVALIIRPDIEDRNFHETTKAYSGPERSWPHAVTALSNGLVFSPASGRILRVNISKGAFFAEQEWYYMVHRQLEAERGMDADSDLFSPGYFRTMLYGGETVTLTAQAVKSNDETAADWRPLHRLVTETKGETDADCGFEDALTQALSSYVVRRDNSKTVIAGYPWFLDWGRDTLIFVRGLIAAGKTEDARAILRQFGQFEQNGTIPNMIRGDNAGNRDTSDAPLWFFTACSDITDFEQDLSVLDMDCAGRSLRDVLINMGRSIMTGTPNGIKMDPESGLIFSPSHFTWMDTNYPACTPREGYPIEIQALWHKALSFLAEIDISKNNGQWKETALLVRKSITELFLLEKEGFFSDCLHAGSATPARRAKPDDALRPNQLFAVTLGAVNDKGICRKIVAACEELLVPGAIRTLADREVKHLLKITLQGKTINDPRLPYYGTYEGDEDTRRKPAYHNGTAWTWVFPSFCEAWVIAYGDSGKDAALSWLASSIRHINYGCTGHVPEILDGDYPHNQRGCDAQAWGLSELLRVWKKIKT
ncbi:Amylo-alpha-16-glucosidase [uncultured Desulfobacterium sp.]|uniref:Amylo-alpha-16-glucosidase n=1 Tax=uncultured Desulfobacterium sp. TaxID=201089 RepID=A0A445N413_9BACT|nr:Amylo-alpha-16-glucosidase [uncultured Desulfobacterium sp.]